MIARAVRFAWKPVRLILLGRRFVISLDRNREAADRLDMVLKEMLEQ